MEVIVMIKIPVRPLTLTLAFFLILGGCNQLTSSISTSNELSTSEIISSDDSTTSETISSVDSSTSTGMKESMVKLTSAPDEITQYEEMELYANGVKVDLYNVKVNDSQFWNGLAPNRTDAAVAIIQLEGKVTLTIQAKVALNYETKVRPLSYHIYPFINVENKTITFEIFNVGQYVVEINGTKEQVLHLFVQPIREQTVDKNSNNVLYFGSGLHNSNNDARIVQNTVALTSNQIVYLEYGAVVQARFIANNSSNIQIIGGGVINGSTFPRIAGQPSGNTHLVPIEFNNCENITLQDFTILDPAGWAVQFYFTNNSVIDNIHIITSRSNGDGISLQSTQNIQVSNSFVRSWDDNLVVKNYPLWSNRSIHGTTRNIHFNNMLLWTDLAQSMEVGYETVGQIMEDITFKDITVFHNYHKPVMSIHNGNNADIKNVAFEGITVEDASMGQGDARNNNQLIDIRVAYSSTWSDQHTITSLGSIDGVTIKNVKVLSGNTQIPLAINGSIDTRSAYSGSIHFVSNVTLTDIAIKNIVLTNSYPYLQTNEYVKNVSVNQTGETITGATILRKWSKEEMKTFSKTPIVYLDGLKQ